jgi:hypothetical protein
MTEIPVEPPSEWQATRDRFHMHLGYCVAEWSNLDEWLFQIFQSCVGAPEQCSIIYYKQTGLEPRLSLTDEIVRSVLPKPQRKSGGHQPPSVIVWNQVKKNIDKLISTRRRIAHHQVSGEILINYNSMMGSMGFNESSVSEMISWFSIYMSQSESLRGRHVDNNPLEERDLISHAASVRSAAEDLSNFYSEYVAKRPGAHPPLSHPLIREKVADHGKDDAKASLPRPRSSRP